jgi:replication initiation and membrane attachment protein
MSAHWKEVLPVDQYAVVTPDPIHLSDLERLSSLYQPLIGALACQVYTTLSFEAKEEDIRHSHYHLMVKTSHSLEVLFQERKKLEAIGLLAVYKKTMSEATIFYYELKRPLDPEYFFTDGLLNIYLYNRVGRAEYLRLKDLFIKKSPPFDEEGVEEVTAAFNDVFTSLRPSELKDIDLEGDTYPISRAKPSTPKLAVSFDFYQLSLHLSDVILSEEAFTDSVKEAIEQLAYVYHVTPPIMAQIIQQAFLHSGEIDIPTLRKAVRDYYQLENGDQLPALSLRAQTPKATESADNPPANDYEATIQLFERLSPYEFLKRIADGAEPVQSDLRIVEGLLFDQKLEPGVVNVLLDYTMLVNDKKLIKSYIEKIASHWARKKVRTVREAMALAKSEHKKYQAWRTPSSTRSQAQAKRQVNTRQDRLPKWMKNEQVSSTNNTHETVSKQEEASSKDREKWLEDFLNNL